MFCVHIKKENLGIKYSRQTRRLYMKINKYKRKKKKSKEFNFLAHVYRNLMQRLYKWNGNML